MTTITCQGCNTQLPYKGRGRPPKWCKRCRNAQLAEKQRAYYKANKAEIAEKQRAYRKANKAELAEKQRSREGKVCGQCGEHLRQPTADGLCGFCREEALRAAA